MQDEETALDVNLKGNIHFVETYVNSSSLKAILFTASSSARNGAEFPIYSASKGGLVTYMKNLAVRLANRKVVVNSISPGGVVTPLNDHILNNKTLYEAVINETLLKKWSEASEIAE